MHNYFQKSHITESEAATIFGIGVRQFRNMRMRGDGPPWIKISGQIGHPGGRVLYEVSVG